MQRFFVEISLDFICNKFSSHKPMQVNVSTCNVSFEINKYVCKKFKIIRKLDKQNIMSSELN